MEYEIHGGQSGNYQIYSTGATRPLAFVRRNQVGGGYTVELADNSKSIQMRNMPVDNQADIIMGMINDA